MFILLFCSQAALSQVGINPSGSSPHPSAGLDVSYPDKGLLIPRVLLLNTSDAVTIPSPAVSLMVYNLNTAGSGYDAVTPGYYYWNGTFWMRINSGTDNTKWSLTGNSGTNPSTNFLGTTDSINLIFKVNGRKSGIIDLTDRNTGFGYKSLYSNTTGFNNTANGYFALRYNRTGNYNTATGVFALIENTTGYYNTATGFQALYYDTTGHSNTATGAYALAQNITGNFNTAGGYYALFSNYTGHHNTAMGDSALCTNESGKNNTGLGYYADVSSTNLTNATALGYHAVATSSNQMRLGNSDVASFYCMGAYAATSSNAANLVVDNNGQIMRSTAASAGWSLTGNSGTDPSINFIGTTDSKDFVIKSNSAERMRFLGSGEDRIGGITDYSKFENDGTLEFTGAATVWNEVVIPGISGKPATVAPDFLKFRDNGSGSTGVWQYQYQHKEGIEESIFFNIEMPHDLKEGTSIVPHLHWTPMTTGSGNVTWTIEYTWIDDGGTFGPTSFASGTTTVGSQYKAILTSFGWFSPATNQKHIYSILCVRLFRNIVSGTDTYIDRAALLSFDVAYETNTVGSRTMWAK